MITWDAWLLTAARTAIHLPTRTAVVSDLHLGYAETRRRAGEAVPLVSVTQSLHELGQLLTQQALPHLILAGDIFESGPKPALCDELLAWLDSVGVQSVRVLQGNHDHGLSKAPERLRPSADPVFLDDWQIVHGDGELPTGKFVQGHLHPALRVRFDLPLVPCFLTRSGHLVLPAYCPEAAGVDVSRRAPWTEYECHAIVGSQVIRWTGR